MRLGLLARIILILALAFFAIQLFALVFFFGASGGRDTLGQVSPSVPRQVGAIVELFETLPSDLRPVAIDALAEQGRNLAIVPVPPADMPEEPLLNRVRTAILGVLRFRGLPERDVRVRFVDGQPSGGGDTLQVYVRLHSGDYLALDIVDHVTVRLLGIPIGFFAGLFGVVVALVALFAVAREMKPLTRLAREVERVGERLGPQPIPEQGAPEVRALVRAVNAMQERIAALVKNRTLTLGAISHDLRTHLTRLRLRVEMMPDGPHRAGAVVDVEGMQALVEDTLDFARTSLATSDRTSGDLAGLLRRFAAEHPQAARLIVDAPPGEVRVALGEPALERIVSNLVENALRFGGLTHVGIIPGRPHVELTVEDDGPGIPASERAHVFEPFHRLEGSRNRESGGSGLGLTIVRRIAEMHGGAVTLESSALGGLMVRVSLPAAGDA